MSYTHTQTFSLVLLRLFIGWHFLYEGLEKFFHPGWTARHYLADSQGYLSFIFHNLADNPILLSISNNLNIYGLILVGLGLILGCLSRYAAMGGIAFLLIYYLSHPPFVGVTYLLPSEGPYLWIDKNLIEAAALLVLILFPTSQKIGLDRYIHFKRK